MPETRLIDADKAIAEIERIYCDDCDSHNGVMCRACGYQDAMDIIDDSPTVDAVPVKRGHWITTQKTIDDNITTCSNCKREFYIENLVEVGNENGYCEFCPSCGADMRGGTDA